jgi:histidyl-tRNA synthetase
MQNQQIISGAASGFRDYYGKIAEQRNELLQLISKIYVKYGYERLETPCIERLSTLRGKGGEESERLIYEVMDTTNESKLGLRFDLTIPLARYITQNKGNISYPFKRFAYGDVFRGESPQMQKGRLRGFIQCDADCVGLFGTLVDAEVLELMRDIFSELQVNVNIRINNRNILDAFIEYCNITDESQKSKFLNIIDSLDKDGVEKSRKFVSELFGDEVLIAFDKFLKISELQTNNEILFGLNELLGSYEKFKIGYKNLMEVLTTIDINLDNIKIDPKIVRGLDYYTGIIFETFVIGHEDVGSVCSGGRYDKLIEDLGGPSVPAIGTSVGIDRLLIVLSRLNDDNSKKSNYDAFVTVFDESTIRYSLNIARILRNSGKKVYLWLNSDTKISKQISECSKKGIKYCIIAGSNEIEKGVVVLKNMETQTQSEIQIDKLNENLI